MILLKTYSEGGDFSCIIEITLLFHLQLSKPGMTRFGPKVVHTDPNGTNPGYFPAHNSVHFGSVSENLLKCDLKRPCCV